MTRKVILHYHLFKNAGTSVDALLQANFPGKWVTREFNGAAPAANLARVQKWIGEEANAIAFSSHTAMLPPPSMQDVEVFPIIFVRHPLDRIASAYAFEHGQKSDSFGAVLARNTTMGGYIDVRLSIASDRQCRNFHAARLALMFSGDRDDEAARALKAVDHLPFVGLVEEFNLSIRLLERWLSPHFPGFKPLAVAKNVTRDRGKALEQKLEELRVDIGDACYSRLLEANATDLEIFRVVQQRVLAAQVALPPPEVAAAKSSSKAAGEPEA